LDFRNTLDPLHRQQNMLWLRDWYATIDYTWLGDRYIVHGHTPIPRYTLEDQWNDFETLRVVNIDNGCVFDHPEMGSLCAVDLTQRKLYFEPRHRLDKSGMNP
jgi:serine/threonine protein phosphatase 1